MGDTSLLPPCKIIELVTLPEILCVFLVDASIDLVEVEASVVAMVVSTALMLDRGTKGNHTSD